MEDGTTSWVPTTNTPPPPTLPVERRLEAIPLTITDERYQNLGGGVNEVVGKVTNTDKVVRSVMITVIYFLPDGTALEGGGAVETKVRPGEKRVFSVRTSRDIGGFTSFKAQANAF